MMRRVEVLIALSVALSSFACGDDEVLPQRSADAGVAPTPDGGALTNGLYDDPGDFDRSGCSSTARLDQADLVGIHHLEILFEEFGRFSSTMRIDGASNDYSALLFGTPADSISVDEHNVLLRRQWYSEENGHDRVQALLLCDAEEPGKVNGIYASCRGQECLFGEVAAHKVNPLPGPVSSNMTLISEFNGTAENPWPLAGEITANVRVKDGIAYVARFADGLRIVDISDPTTPVELGHAPTIDQQREIINDIKLIVGTDGKQYVLAASSVRGTIAYDVSDPSNPTIVSRFPIESQPSPPVDVHTLFVEGTRAYLANTEIGGLDIFDVADPRNPVHLGRWIHPDLETRGGYLHDLFIENGRAYLNYWNLGMVILDTKDNPANPSVVGVFDQYPRRTSHSAWVSWVNGRKVAVHGDEGFGAHVRIVDVNPESVAFLNVLGEYKGRPYVSVHNIMAVDNLALVTYYQDGLRVLDLSDPSKPTEIAHYNSWPGAEPGYGLSFFEGAIGVDYDASTKTVYLADTHRGLIILRLDP